MPEPPRSGISANYISESSHPPFLLFSKNVLYLNLIDIFNIWSKRSEGIFMIERSCEICKSKIELSDNSTGLVFDDRFFICSDCQANKSEEEIQEFCNSVMQHPDNGMPIALWLIHEHNKDMPIFSQKKR